MFGERLLSGIILMILTIALMFFGGVWLLIALYLISMIGLFELYRSVGIEKTWLSAVGFAACTAFYAILFFNIRIDFMFISVCVLLLLLIAYVFAYPKHNTEQIALAFFGFLYVACMLSFVYQVRVMEGGIWLVWLIFICAWGSDTSAYVFGMLLGKHKLPSPLSPKKSIEGCIGGVFGAALIGCIFAIFAKDHINLSLNIIVSFGCVCAVGSILSQIGDLAASAIKRNHNIKDYGDLIPGHGGILDRFDSIIFVAPIVYYLIIAVS